MQRKTLVAVTAIALTSLLSAESMADATPEDAKDYRSAIMTALRGHIGAASMIARGLIDNDGQLVSHAQGLNNGAMELSKLFPEGSNVGESEALPAIWKTRMVLPRRLPTCSRQRPRSWKPRRAATGRRLARRFAT